MIGSAGSTDRELARDCVITLRAVLDLGVAIFDEPVLERRLRMRRVARSQLDVCARIVEHLAAGQSAVPVPARSSLGSGAAAAAGTSDPVAPAPFCVSEEVSGGA